MHRHISGQITATFLMAGMLAALAGTITGLGGGLLVARFINQIIAAVEAVMAILTTGGPAQTPKLLDEGYYLQNIPIHIRWGATALIGGATFGLSVLASVIPASRAAGLKPLEVLRKH
jgi:lipoprotein-releasing system permease protein